MCGIVGYCDNSDVYSRLIGSLKSLEYRGYDSCGIAVINSHLQISKAIGTVESLSPIYGNIGIGHTRWATHGEVNELNAHPHTDCSGKLAIVHNGIIENYQELKNGHIIKSDTDSEIIAHLVATNLYLGLEEAVKLALPMMKGSFAILAICEGENRIVAARRNIPLYIGEGCASSDNVGRLLDEDEVVSIYPAHSTSTAIQDRKLEPHFMLQEILEQRDREWDLKSIALEILRAKDITFIGCGSSRYAAIIGRFYFSSIAGINSDVVLASELQNFSENINRHSLVIAISQSGETADVLEGVRLAKSQNARVISIVNRRDSLLEKLSDNTIYLGCGSEIAVAATKSFTSQLCLLYHLSCVMAGKECVIEHFLSEIDDTIPELLKDKESVYYIAKGINYPIALEGALKLKEVAYIHAEAIPSGELKHGSLALISEGAPVIAICPKDSNFDSCINNIMEIKARGGYVIGISDVIHKAFDYHIQIPNATPMACVIPLQLIAYKTALLKGINPDRPRNLAKSVTVK